MLKYPEPRPRILEIDPYVGGSAEIAGKKNVIKLSSNEAALGPSGEAIRAYKAHSERISRYPDGGASELKLALCGIHNIDPNRIVCGAGSDELLQLLCRAYAGPGDEVLFTEHGFLVYKLAALASGASPIAVPETNLCANVDQILNAVSKDTRIIFIANPNNPTGSYLSRSEIHRLWSNLPSNIILVIDAAYAEYAGLQDYNCGIDLVDSSENVVMTRTFSKLYGLASLRVGWCYAPGSIVDVLNRVRGPFNVTGAAIEAATAALSDRDHINKSLALNDKWLNSFPDQLSGTKIKCLPSAGNFILMQFPSIKGQSATDAEKFLIKNGIIVRNVESYGLPDCLRITMGLDHEMETVILKLNEFARIP
tara:strand:- start:33763 stop:34860 length:1098 start_codon:yes stop_codon:yes gene_type:complete